MAGSSDPTKQAVSVLKEAISKIEGINAPASSSTSDSSSEVVGRASTSNSTSSSASSFSEAARRDFRLAFPSLSGGGKRFYEPKTKKSRKTGSVVVIQPKESWTHDFCLLSGTSENMSPSLQTVCKLKEAGLGRKKITFPDKHGRFSHLKEILEQEFPQLKTQDGAFDLLRAETGGTNRPLKVIPMPAEGYNIPHLKNLVSGSTLIYIRPIKSNLSLIKVPEVASVNSPRTDCDKCKQQIPLIDLRKHYQSCGVPENDGIETDFNWMFLPDDDFQSDSDIIEIASLTPVTKGSSITALMQSSTCSTPVVVSSSKGTTPHPSTTTQLVSYPSVGTASSVTPLRKVVCPTCLVAYPISEIEEHADMCCDQMITQEGQVYSNLFASLGGETQNDNLHDDIINEEQGNVDPTESPAVELKDILSEISNHVEKKSFRIHVRRKHLWEDFVEARKRPWVKPTNALKVVFVDEPAVDDGGPRREFLTETIEVIKQRLFVTEASGGHSPRESTMALTDGSFSFVGEILAISIAQGGPPPNFLCSWVYDYLCAGLKGVELDKTRLKETEFKNVAEKIDKVTTEDELHGVLLEEDVIDALDEVGYRSLYIKVCVEPKLPMFDQLANGLELFGVLDAVKKNPGQLRKLFTSEDQEQLPADDLLDMLKVTFSLNEGVKDQAICTYKSFCDFVQLVDCNGIPDCQVSVKDILKFITGCQQMPALGFPTAINVSFVYGCQENCKCRPTASTCDLHLHLPLHINSLDSMIEAGVSMLKECFGFGVI